jgi:hypothetical protein
LSTRSDDRHHRPGEKHDANNGSRIAHALVKTSWLSPSGASNNTRVRDPPVER